MTRDQMSDQQKLAAADSFLQETRQPPVMLLATAFGQARAGPPLSEI